MSPHAVNSFVSDLVFMAQAMEELPKIKAELASANDTINAYADNVDGLKAEIEQAKAYAATLEQKVHDLEVAKDAAETMFLQADDRTMRAVEFIKAQFGAAGSLIQALEPPKPMPEPDVHTAMSPKAIHEALEKHGYPVEETVREDAKLADVISGYPYGEPAPQVSEVKPIAADPTSAEHSNTDILMEHTSTSFASAPPQGQSEPDPTVVMENTFQSSSALTHPVSESSDAPDKITSWATPAPDTKSQPYAGKRYIDIDGWVSFSDWEAGGGTYASYWADRT